MKILQLSCENFKRLKVVSIKPDGSLVQISGRNGSGKSSCLDAIFAALAGKDAIQKMPIRKGQESAMIRLDMGKLIVTRHFTQERDKKTKELTGGYTTKIEVATVEGAHFDSPQAILDSLLGSLSFDPLAFMRMSPEGKRDALKKLVPGLDFDALDAANKADYDRRTEINRGAKSAKAQVEGIELPEAMPAFVDETALLDEMQRAGEHNIAVQKQDNEVGHERSSIADLKSRAGEQRALAAKLRQQAEEASLEAVRCANEADEREEAMNHKAILEPIDISTVRTKLAQAREQNAKAKSADDAKLRRDAYLAEQKSLEEQSAQLTEAMAQRDRQKATAMAEAKMPIEGLSITASGVSFGEIPLEQASDAEQLRVSIAIAAAMNPRLRVLRVRDGSLLDEDGLKALADFCEQNDFQVWIERVDTSGKIGFILEDGMLKEQQEQLELKA